MKGLEDIKELLLADLPKEAVKKHPTKPYLSTIKAAYVTERFNDVFGVGKWQTQVEKENLDLNTGMVVVKVTFQVPELKIYYECYGGNDNGGINSKNFDLGDAYKGATTDALTKIGSYLGVGIKVFKGLGDVNPGNKTKAPQVSTKQVEPSDLDIAKAEAVGCKTVKSLEDTWNAYPELHNNTEFKKHINSLKLKL